MLLTTDHEASSAAGGPRVTGVVTCIFLLNSTHQQLCSCALLGQLVLGTWEKLQCALAPLYTHVSPAQFTAQVCRGPLVHLLGL